MPLNRNDLIKRFIGIASNIIVHRILIKSELEDDLRGYYSKEVERDLDIAFRCNNISFRLSALCPLLSFLCLLEVYCSQNLS